MINLDNITILNLNCVDPDIGVKAIKYSCREINFGKKMLVSHVNPKNITSDIEYVKTDFLDRNTINDFFFNNLNDLIQTEFVLSIHTDGFVIHPELWNDNFLNYDYIGAPWPPLPWCIRNRVGNGGFVLISKKFLSLLSKISRIGSEHNDVSITNRYYDFFINNGCSYAPLDIASKFSLELPIPEVKYSLSNCFGFHGQHTDESRFYCEMIKTFL
jgi:hypothetical protein